MNEHRELAWLLLGIALLGSAMGFIAARTNPIKEMRRSRWRFSIRSLLVATALLAIALWLIFAAGRF